MIRWKDDRHVPRKLVSAFVASSTGWGFFLASTLAFAIDIEREPIRYSEQRRDNPIEELQKRIESGEATFTDEKVGGRLKSVLAHLNISPSTQTLVFSKTSLQRNRISRRARVQFISMTRYTSDSAVEEKYWKSVSRTPKWEQHSIRSNNRLKQSTLHQTNRQLLDLPRIKFE